MHIVLNILSYIFMIFITYIFLNSVYKKPKKYIPKLAFCASFVATESLLCISFLILLKYNFPTRALINLILNIFCIYILSFLYEAKNTKKVFSAFLFEILAIISEGIFTTIMAIIHPNIFSTETELLYSIMSFGSQIVLFIICIIIGFVIRRKEPTQSPENKLIELTTPIISAIILVFVPIDTTSYLFFGILMIFLCLLSIVNVYLSEKIFILYDYKNKTLLLERQEKYQADKYTELSNAYKNTRKLIHDTKEHYFMLNEYIANKEYEKASVYLDMSLSGLDKQYITVNTGNLVIDSFLSNFISITQNEGIDFNYYADIDNSLINISDYDMSVMLGNILDNCLNACRKINDGSPRTINLEIYTNSSKNQFIIHSVNTYDHSDHEKKNSLIHGYGSINVEETAKKYLGSYRGLAKDQYDTIIAIPIIKNQI